MTSPGVPFPKGVESADFDDIITDSAVAWQRGNPISITRGSLSFEPNEERENYDFPGKTAPVVGLDEVVRSRPVVKGTMMMTGEAQFLVYSPGGTWGDGTTVGGVVTTGVRTFTPGDFRTPLSSGAYLRDFIVIWKRLRGDYIGVEFPIALCTHYDLKSADGDEGMIAVEFEARQPNDGAPARTPVYRVVTVPTTEFTPGETPEGELPEGFWGTILFDANGNGPSMLALGYADDEDVDQWPDETAYGNHLTTDETSGLPKYKPTGFGANNRPCVEWSGANVFLSGDNPVFANGGSWTIYLVIENLDGNDGAKVYGDEGNSSFSWYMTADNSQICATCNNAFGATTCASDTWGMSGAHIYRFVKSSASAHWHMFVDGVMVLNVANAPQSSDTAIVRLMDDLGGSGASARIGRVVAYSLPHRSPNNDGTLTNGLTEPELVLQAYFGTP